MAGSTEEKVPVPPQEAATILVADDGVGPRESLKMILIPPHTVLTAGNGRDALALFESEKPDIVISDIRMPVMNGVELMKAVKERSPETPVILITGYGTLETAQEAVRAGAMDYISKPYDVAEIRSVVGKAIKIARARSEEARAVARLRSMNRELEEQIRELDQKASIGDLSAEMIHDLNNPMSILRGYIALLEDSIARGRRATGEGEEKEFLDIIKEQIDRCMRLTQNFLDYARSAKRNWDQESVNEIIEDALFVLRVRMRTAGINLETRLDSSVPLTWLQPTPLQQVIYNLVSNAIEAMAPAGSGSLVIASAHSQPPPQDGAAETAENGIEITVSDTGPGIPPDELDKIFTPFFTTKPKGEGTGLGLAICKRVVEEHGGRLTVTSGVAKGTTFRICLPVLTEKPESREDAAAGAETGTEAGEE
jgi:two-component system NtrC family sensor kinase